MIQTQKHKNYKQKHKMCKTNVKMKFYYANTCKHEHGKNITSYGAKSSLKLMLNILKEIRGHTSIIPL